MTIEEKKQLGQFFTTNSNYILKNFSKYIKGKNVIDPFAGGGDLIFWANKKNVESIKGYDVDERRVDNKNIFYNDSLNNPKKYEFVLTNPPYLNVNKANKKMKDDYFRNHQFEDLYQISLNSIMDSDEGIIIVPINFLSARNSKKIRNIFFSKFQIIEMNYFKKQVFEDTTYNVISFYYRKKKNIFDDKFMIKTHIYPDNKIVNIKLEKNHDWSIGGKVLSMIKKQNNSLGVHRLVADNLNEFNGKIEVKVAYNHTKNKLNMKVDEDFYNLIKSNIILLKAIDSGSENGKIALEDVRDYGVDCLVSKTTSRHMIYLLFDKKVSLKDQKMIINLFNNEISKLREEYLSLFLTNYRDNDRKRISFDFVYKFINFLYFNKLNKNDYGQLRTFEI